MLETSVKGVRMAALVLNTEAQFTEFLVSVSETSRPLLSPTRFSKRLQWPIQSLADRAHVHRNTVAKTPGAPAIQAYLRNVLKVIRVALELTQGDLNRSLIWFQNSPIAEFEYRTADELVAAGETEAVVKYLESVLAGPTG